MAVFDQDFNRKKLASALSQSCGMYCVNFFKRHGKLIRPDKKRGWITERKTGWRLCIGNKISSAYFKTYKDADDFVKKHITNSIVIINRETSTNKEE